MIVDLHFYAVSLACNRAFEICELLPETDLVDSLAWVIETQGDVLSCVAQQKHYGSDALLEFINELNEIKKQIESIREGF